MSREELENVIATTGNEEIKKMAQAELQKLDLIEKASKGDELSIALMSLKEVVDAYKQKTIGVSGASISKEEIEKMLEGALKGKVSVDDLDPELRAKLTQQVKVQLTLKTPTSQTMSASTTMLDKFERPLFQKILSDFLARNNVYLFGGAGTGKTFMAKDIANFLGYELITVNCNQFTSSLDLLGGQTITGYQKGRLEMAWENIDEKGNKMTGAVLLLDELPKIDPNTAGILNEALAKVKDFGPEGQPPTIRNGRGQLLTMGNLFVIATGNTKLNETNVEYEANFKQDLSLQDRFSGSIYEVTVDYENEWNQIMKGFAFIWIYMTKMREIILENKLTGFAFVSIRIMTSMKETYLIFREYDKTQVGGMTLTSPKTLKNALDSFLNLFKPNQIDLLKTQSNYDEFIRTVETKNKLPLGSLDTKEELEIVAAMIKKNQEMIKAKIA